MIRSAALLLAILSSSALAAPASIVRLDRGWSVRLAPGDPAAAAHPRAARWFAATVPGSVQQDLIATRQVPDPFLGTHEGAIQWAGLAAWEYRTSIEASDALLARDHVDLVFDGLDTFAELFVNGRRLLAADNAHRRWRVPAKAVLHPGANALLIRFRSPIKALQPKVLAEAHPLPGEYDSIYGDEPEARQTSPYIRKPKYHYGWDWGPRIVTIGPWKGVRIEAWDQARIDAMRVAQEAVTPASARLTAGFDLVAGRDGPATVRVTLTPPAGPAVTVDRRVDLIAGRSPVTVPLDVARPSLWWPAGYGPQPLYTIEATLLDADGRPADGARRRIGIRTVALRREADAAGRSFALVVNGVPVFAKGANLIPFDAFPAGVPEARIRTLLTAARDSNMNMLRVWGGGVYPDEAFYDIADELGLMVWQDFMFGGSITPPDRDFRETVRIEAEEQVDRLGSHPSLVLWSGNNEVLSGWANWSDRIAWKKAVGADEQERTGVGMAILFDRVLRDAAERRDPDAVYWPGSPSANYEAEPDQDRDGDRHYWDVWGGKKPVTDYLATCPRFMSEYGLEAMPDMKTVRAFAGDGPLDIHAPVMKAHQKYLKGEGNDRLAYYILDRYRAPRDFAEFVYLSQVMQAEGIGLAALHHRACRPVTMGSLYWQLNDVWPVTSWSSIDWYGRWKALQFHARRFYAPLAIAAERRDARTRISLISDRRASVAAEWRLRLIDMDGRTLRDERHPATLAPLASAAVATLPDADLFGTAVPATTVAVADLLVDGAPVSRALIEPLAPKAMAWPDPGLSTRWEGDRLTLTAARIARAVWIDFGAIDATLSDNAFDLLPGESRTVRVTSTATPAALARALHVRTLFGRTLFGERRR